MNELAHLPIRTTVHPHRFVWEFFVTVYLVTELIPYEGEETLAVFSTEEKAEEFKKSMEAAVAKDFGLNEKYYVVEMRVDQP